MLARLKQLKQCPQMPSDTPCNTKQGRIYLFFYTIQRKNILFGTKQPCRILSMLLPERDGLPLCVHFIRRFMFVDFNAVKANANILAHRKETGADRLGNSRSSGNISP